jgi:hypothetical protein
MAMNTICILILLLLSGIALGYLVFFRKKKTRQHSEQVSNKISGEEFVQQIYELGYFKYAANVDVENLKVQVAQHFNQYTELYSDRDEKTRTPKDYRIYSCDGEDVFEEGGIMNMLKELEPAFEKIGFKFNITNHIEEWDEQNRWVNQSLVMNGTGYIIFKNFEGQGWGEAPYRLADILNKEFEKHGIEERIYLAAGGNDGGLFVLTPALYKYIYTVFTSPELKPLEITEWANTMDVKLPDYY